MNYSQKGARIGESSPNGRMITAIFRLVKYSCASVIQPGKTIHNVYIYINIHIMLHTHTDTDTDTDIYIYIYLYIYGGVLKSRGIRKSPLFQY